MSNLMGDQEKQIFGEMGLMGSRPVKWAAMKKDENCESIGQSSSIYDSEASSCSSLSSSDLADDTTSSSTSSPHSCGPLYELAELMVQLPIKRGLSKYYHGKSQSFASLANAGSVEDLAKKETLYSQRMKSCKSHGANLNYHKFGPKPTIAKRSPKGSFSSSLATKGQNAGQLITKSYF